MKNAQSWYVVLKGKADGPHTEEEIREQLKSGKLTYSDLAFRPGFARWIPIVDCKEFERRTDSDLTSRTASLLDVPEMKNVEGWILLVQHANIEGRANHYIQSGPYSTAQIQEKLQKNEVGYDDYVWKQGFEVWTTLGTLGEFERRLPKISSDADKAKPSEKPTPTTIEKSDSDATIIMTKPISKSTEVISSVPTQQDSSTDPDKTVVQFPSASKQEPATSQMSTHQELEPIPDILENAHADGPVFGKAKRQKIAIAAVGSLLGMALTYAGVRAYHQNLVPDNEKDPERITTSIPSPPALPAPPAQPVPPVPTTPALQGNAVNPEIENRIPKKPELLKVFSLKGTSGAPQIGLETDLPPGTVIRLHVWADTGSILKFPNYSLTRTIEVKAGQLPVIDLTSEKLPNGNYHLQASHHELQGTANLTVGILDDQFKRKLEIFKKQIEKQQKSEKQALKDGVKFVGQTLTLFSQMSGKAQAGGISPKWIKTLKIWNSHYKDEMEVLKGVTETKRDSFVYPDQLLKLKNLEVKLRSLAKLYYHSQKSGRQIASEDDALPKLKTEFKDLQEEIRTMKK